MKVEFGSEFFAGLDESMDQEELEGFMAEISRMFEGLTLEQIKEMSVPMTDSEYAILELGEPTKH